MGRNQPVLGFFSKYLWEQKTYDCDIPTAGRGQEWKIRPEEDFFPPEGRRPEGGKNPLRAEFFIPAQGQL